jgi:hypothetical protein
MNVVNAAVEHSNLFRALVIYRVPSKPCATTYLPLFTAGGLRAIDEINIFVQDEKLRLLVLIPAQTLEFS